MRVLAVGLTAIALLAGCSSMSIQTDHSLEADFSQFQTFRYEESSQSLATAEPLSDQRIVAAIRREMIASGLQEAEADANVVVTYYATIDQQLQFQTVYTGVGGWGHRGRMGMSMSTASTRATTFEQGTMVIDIWQPADDLLVWRGTVSDSLSGNTDRNREMVDRGITRAFEDFPPS
jgi:hypothetical protein